MCYVYNHLAEPGLHLDVSSGVALYLAPGSDYEDDIALGKCQPIARPLQSGQGQAIHS